MRTTKCVVFAVMALALFGCGVRDDAYNPSRFHLHPGALVPPDIVFRKPVQSGDVIGGLHLGGTDDPTTSLCCWVDSRATVTVSKKSGDDTLHIGVYVPETEPSHRNSQRWRIAAPAGIALSSPALHPGMNAIALPLPNILTRLKGRIPLAIRISNRPGVTPKQNAAVLVSAYFTRANGRR